MTDRPDVLIADAILSAAADYRITNPRTKLRRVAAFTTDHTARDEAVESAFWRLIVDVRRGMAA